MLRTVCSLTAVTLISVLPALRAAEPLQIGTFPQEVRSFFGTDQGLPSQDVLDIQVAPNGDVFARTTTGWAVLHDGAATFEAVAAPQLVLPLNRDTTTADNLTAGLPWTSRLPGRLGHQAVSDRKHSWLPNNSVVVRDGQGRYWVGDTQGVARLTDGTWTLFTPAEGVPRTDFTSAAAGDDGVVWLGTGKGLVRFDGAHWAYRQGKRWLPGDEVRAISVAADNSAWVATNGGVSHIHFRNMTLAEKAKHYEELIDRYNRRTEYGYVLEAHCQAPGDPSQVSNHDSDNDGLWTAMYGAGECYAWAATKDPAAKKRAQAAFQALRYLSLAPRGGSNPAPKGFIARTVVPTDQPNPNERRGYTLEGQKEGQKNDTMWRAYEPRWPTTEDGKYYWKSDTSSDELDGHYFFNALYYDLVAETEEEKQQVREIVRDNIDHMIEHGFRLYDHAGPTRWADYSPESVNHDIRWVVERGLNSLSMLSYLATAAHITGDSKYHEVAAVLREKHSYHQNLMYPKLQAGYATGNQSDDEMAFMCYYNLLKYEPDANLRLRYLYSFWRYWELESPELNPFFNFCYAVHGLDQSYTTQWSTFSLAPSEDWLTDSADTLRRFPLDRFNWAHNNSDRLDLRKLPGPGVDTSGRMIRTNNKVIPVDECHFNHWNRNPWAPNTGGDGRGLADGAVFLLPYYMGLYHGFIAD